MACLAKAFFHTVLSRNRLNSLTHALRLLFVFALMTATEKLSFGQGLDSENAALRALGTPERTPESIATAQDPEEIPDDATISLADTGAVDLQALCRWAAEMQGYELLLDNEQFFNAKNRVLFFSKVRVNKTTAMLLVQEVLRANGFAMVDAQVGGWKRVANLANITNYAPLVAGDQANRPGFEYITAIVELQHISPETAKNYLETVFLPSAGNQAPESVKAIGKTRLILITDLAKNIERYQQLIQKIDTPQEGPRIEFYEVKNMEAKELEAQLQSVLGSRLKLDKSAYDNQGDSPRPNNSLQINGSFDLKMSTDNRTNRLILVGDNQEIQDILKLIEQLDVPLATTMRSYQLQHISAKRIDDLMRQSLLGTSDALDRIYQSTLDPKSNRLLVSARDEIHAKIEALCEQLDVQSAPVAEQSPMRFYKLKNVKVTEIVDTLQSIERTSRSSRPRRSPMSGIRGRDGFNVNGPNNLPPNFREGPPASPPNFQSNSGAGRFNNTDSTSDSFATGSSQSQFNPSQVVQSDFRSDELNNFAALIGDTETGSKIVPGEAQITVDPNTNTLIVVAEPEVQSLYAELIQKLDVRRPQVLIEAHVVTIEGNDNLNLGVEISGGDRQGDRRLFSFSSFGLSEVNSTSGALKILPGVGFNGTLVDPNTADLVIKALASHSRSRVVSSPKVVVDDNADGLLSSVAEEPFASVNATNTVATTSFAGFAQAGTTINVTPHISEDDYLNLEFDILINSFTGSSSQGLPPPRNTDQIVSQVTIPDGYTVIVGGLNRERVSRNVNGLPFIERVPVLRNLASSRTNSHSEGMTFIFLKPTILRDDQFKDLIYLSYEDQIKAQLDGDFPQSRPLLIR